MSRNGGGRAATARPLSLEALCGSEYGRILAGLIRVVRDVDLAEDVLQEAFAAAVEQWPAGPPENPVAWLFSTARHKAIDRLRKRVLEADRGRTLLDLEADRTQRPPPEHPFRLPFTSSPPTL